MFEHSESFPFILASGTRACRRETDWIAAAGRSDGPARLDELPAIEPLCTDVVDDDHVDGSLCW